MSEQKKTYIYYVPFFYRKGKDGGFGATEFFTDKPITSGSDIDAIISHINRDNRFDGVVVLNYQLLREVDAE